jgi:hypothetical protein
LLAVVMAPWVALASDPASVYPEPPGSQERVFTRFGIELVALVPTVHLQASSGGTSAHCPAGQPFSFFETWMAPPHQAQVLGFDFVGKDADSLSDQAMFAFRVCQNGGSVPPMATTSTLLGSVTSGNPFAGLFAQFLDLSGSNEIADSHLCRYLLRVRLSNQNDGCRGPDVELHKVVMRYRLANQGN